MTERLRIELRSIPMRELFAIKAATGRSLLGEISAGHPLERTLDEQMTSALVWVLRRRENPDLTFDQVFESLHIGEVVVDLGGDANPPTAAGRTTRKRSRP